MGAAVPQDDLPINTVPSNDLPESVAPFKASLADVAINAANKGLAGLPDALLNTPTNIINMAKAWLGAGRAAAAPAMRAVGKEPLPMPELTPTPDFARRGMEALGLINPNIRPEGFAQKAIDYGVPGMIGGALTGGASIPRALVGAGLGALSGEAAGGTYEATKNPALAATAGLITPSAIRAGGQLAEPIVSNVLGFTTGAGPTAIREAARAGQAGGERATAFKEQLRGTAPINEVVDSAKAAVAKLRQDRSSEYRQNIEGIKQDKTALNFDSIDKAVSSVKAIGTYNGKVTNPSAAETWAKIDEIVKDWKTSDPSKFHTPEGLDALKKTIGDVRDSSQFGTPARRVADQVYNAVKNEIVAQAPQYSKVMKDYQVASDLLREMEKTLSINPQANVDTTVRKLQSILRNNANTNYGRRKELGNILQDNGAPNLMPQLAGQALNSVTPRGISGIGSALTDLSAAMIHNPMALPALATTSPRLMGEASYLGGILGRLPQGAPQTSPIVTQGILADILRKQ